VWHHDPHHIETEAQNFVAHTCPQCGAEQFMIDQNGSTPQFCSDGTRCILIGSGEQVTPAFAKMLPVFLHFKQIMTPEQTSHGFEYR